MTRVGSPPRRTQTERSAVTQRRVLQATIDALAEVGFASASTLDIQERAGVSRGRLLHQFGSRDDLMTAAVKHLASEWFNELSEQAELELSEDGPARIEGAVEHLWVTNDSPLFWAAMELWLASRHNPGLAKALAKSEKTIGLVIRQYCDSLFGPELCSRSTYPELRDILLTSMRGVATTYAFTQRDMRQDPHLAAWSALACDRLREDLEVSD